MPSTLTHYRVLLISPSDVRAERDELSKAVDSWNAHIGRGLSVAVELVRWESHSRPELGGRPQELLNKQIVNDCDFGIAIFWARLGTATGEHESGSAEEIGRLIDSAKQVMTYFKTAPVPQEALSNDQYDRLKAFKSKLYSQGLVQEFADPQQLASLITLHLTSLVTQDRMRAEGASEPKVRPPSSPQEDAIVALRAGRQDQILVLQEYLDTLNRQLDDLQTTKQLSNAAFIELLQKTTDIVASFYEVCRIVAAIGNEDAASRIYENFGRICDRYRPMNFVGSFYSTDYDIARFLGQELLLTFIATLVMAKRWRIVRLVLERDVYVRAAYNGNPGAVSIDHLQDEVKLLEQWYSSDQNSRPISPIGRCLKERHDKDGPLAHAPTFEALMEAEYFLFLCGTLGGYSLRWFPQTAPYLQTPPSYLSEASRLAVAEELCGALRLPDLETFRTRLSEHAPSFGSTFSGMWGRHPLQYFDYKKIGSVP